MTNEFNDLVNAFAKVAEKKMTALQEEFRAAADKIMLEMTEALNEAEKKSEYRCPVDETCECEECRANVDLHDDEEVFETVTLNEEEFCADEEPCNIVTIYAKNLSTKPCVAIEYDKEMEPTGAAVAVVNALGYVLADSMTAAGITVKLERIQELAVQAIGMIVVDAALMCLNDENEEEAKSND